jgi:hypothetical protein
VHVDGPPGDLADPQQLTGFVELHKGREAHALLGDALPGFQHGRALVEQHRCPGVVAAEVDPEHGMLDHVPLTSLSPR